ncbi:MAG TPA: TonB-dependent receptor, partial [Nevskiaceae bacterium]|nr:TonB-dependent receptor [Nevskiaceae bacterium]
LGLAAFVDSRSLEETQYQPKISLNWQPDRQTSYFVHWTRGFKGGGFNAFAYRDVDQELRFKPETTTEWGFDFKGSFFGGTLRPNLSLYLMNAKDFQVLGREKPPVVGNSQTCVPIQGVSYCLPPSAVIGLGATRVFNAEHARAQGVEGDITWLAGGFSLFATLGYNDTKYILFTQNECPQTTTATTCDATGKSFAFAPRWDTTLTPSYILPLPWFGLSLTPSFTAQYISRQFLDTHLSHEQPGFMRYNASLALGSIDHGWSLQIIGNNLTDVRTAVRYGDVLPHFEISVPEAPRMVFAQLRWAFER